jgi:hypothetical protein
MLGQCAIEVREYSSAVRRRFTTRGARIHDIFIWNFGNLWNFLEFLWNFCSFQIILSNSFGIFNFFYHLVEFWPMAFMINF